MFNASKCKKKAMPDGLHAAITAKGGFTNNKKNKLTP